MFHFKYVQIPTVDPRGSPTVEPSLLTTTTSTSTVFPTTTQLVGGMPGTGTWYAVPSVAPTTQSALTSEYELVIQEEAEKDSDTSSLAEFFVQR